MLSKYFGYDAVGPVLLWLALVVVIWGFMSPNKGEEERTPAVRHRLLKGLKADPVIWVALVLAGYCAMIALNDGVTLSYDSENAVWKLLPPRFSALPGAVCGVGFVYFAWAIVACAVYAGTAHSLDPRQAVYFGIFGSVVVVLDAVLADASGVGIPPGDAVAYGLWSLIAAGAMFASESVGKRPKEMLAAVALSGCLAALLTTGRAVVIAVFAGALVLLSLLFTICCYRKLRLAGVLRAFLMLTVAIAMAAVAYNWRVGEWESLIPSWFADADVTLGRLAYDNWEAKPWLGVGIGAFPLAAKMIATSADWVVLGPIPDFYGNAWRTVLVELGMIGVVLFALVIGALGYSWFRRVRLRGREFFSAPALLLPVALIATAGVMVFDGSMLHVESLAAFVALSALSINGGT